jgi:hypothetical protein
MFSSIVFPTSGAPLSSEKLTSLTAATTLTADVYNRVFGQELLTNGVLTSGTNWSVSDDFTLTGNYALYNNSAGYGTLYQAVTALARTGRSGSRYRFVYTTASPANTAPTMVISGTAGDFALADVPLSGTGTAGIYTVDFTAQATPGQFKISGTSGASGAVRLDTFSLKEISILYNGRYLDVAALQVIGALITVESASIKFTLDGTTPTTTASLANNGHQADSGQSFVLKSVEEVRQFRAINAVASNGAVIKVTYYYYV